MKLLLLLEDCISGKVETVNWVVMYKNGDIHIEGAPPVGKNYITTEVADNSKD